MDVRLTEEMYRLEERYWWHVNKRACVFLFLRQWGGLPSAPHPAGPRPRILDIGCGTGMMVKESEALGCGMGFDASAEALAFCRRRSLQRLCRAEMNSALPVRSDTVDVVMALDVLEHLDDDQLFLTECYRLLRRQGFLVATVPAYPRLWSYWDISAGHRRRYTLSQLADRMRKAEFRIVRISYYNAFALPAAAVMRWFKRLGGDRPRSSDFLPLPGVLNRALQVLGAVERQCVQRMPLPFGLSVIALAQKGGCARANEE